MKKMNDENAQKEEQPEMDTGKDRQEPEETSRDRAVPKEEPLTRAEVEKGFADVVERISTLFNERLLALEAKQLPSSSQTLPTPPVVKEVNQGSQPPAAFGPELVQAAMKLLGVGNESEATPALKFFAEIGLDDFKMFRRAYHRKFMKTLGLHESTDEVKALSARKVQ